MQAMSFHGRGTEYFKIWIVNVLLTIVTVGLYYPWAKVRNRRYFAANTELEGRNFEYHATGKQLFVGYLVSIVFLVVFVVLQNLFPVAGSIMMLVLFLLIPWVIWRSVKFNMRMTSFSNVRFGFDGTLGGSYFNYFFLLLVAYCCLAAVAFAAFFAEKQLEPSKVGLMVSLTALFTVFLGLYLFSYIKKRQTGYLVNGYRFGQGQFATTVATGGFAKILLKICGLTLLLFILVLIVLGGIALAFGLLGQLSGVQDIFASQDPEAMEALLAGGAWILVPVLYFLLLLLGNLVYAYGYTRNRHYIMGNSLLDEKVGFASTLSARRVAWVMATNLLLIILTLGLGMPWAKVRMARLMAKHTQVDTKHGFDEYMSQKENEQSALGEQIGDAFDVDVGIGF